MAALASAILCSHTFCDFLEPFRSNPNRDASAAIAGFVYQVDVTLLRWLNLQLGEMLELERGEDIDVIRETLSKCDERILEQVKHRSSTLTLKSPEAISAIANFCEHKRNNHEHRLRFRFLTTSGVGKEKDWGLPGTAIESWEAVRLGRLSEDARSSAVAAIRSFLLACPQPSNVNSTTWACLRGVLDSDDTPAFTDVIETFEWSTSSGDQVATESGIKRALMEAAYAANETSAQSLFDRLFVFVFKKLSQPGPKYLTRDQLSQQLQQPALVGADLELSVFLLSIRSLSERLGIVEEQLQQQQGMVAVLQTQMARFGSDSAGIIQVEYREPIPNLDAPSLAQPLIRRPDVISGIIEGFTRSPWVNIVGEPGTGKTQLCLLTAQKDSRAWINLRGSTEDRACAILDAAVEAASGVASTVLVREWYVQAVPKLQYTLIIIDDLPQIFAGGRLAQRMEFLTSACRDTSVRILTSSYYQLPRSLVESTTSAELNAPRLSDAEIGELLALYGAPANVTNAAFVDFVGTLTHRLPVLVTAVARFLASRKWIVDPDSFQSLLQGQFAQGVRKDAERVIRATVPDAETRELLYRLRLVTGYFSKSEVEAVARVPVRVKLGLEKLKELTGLWVQEYEHGRYLVSALLDNSISDYLEVKTKRGVHATLALQVLSKKKLDPVGVFNAFHHFVAADLVQQAVVVLVQALLSLWLRHKTVEDWGISQIWAERVLPNEVDINLRLFLRALQISTLDRQGKETSFLFEDLDRLLNDRSAKEQWGVYMAASLIVIQFAFKNPSRANKYLLVALRNGSGEKILLPDGSHSPIPSNARLEAAVWVTANKCSSSEDVEDWLRTIEKLTPEQLGWIAECDIAKDSAVILCDAIWMREYRKPESDRDWDHANELLMKVEAVATRVGLHLLRATAIRTQIVILAESQGRIDEAVTRAELALPSFLGDDERFLLLEVTGRQLTYADRWAEGVTWLKQSLATNVGRFPLLLRNVLITLSEGVSRDDVKQAPQYTQRAVEVAQKPVLDNLRAAEALAEHSIALFFAGDQRLAFDALSRGVEILMAGEDLFLWKKTFLLFLHVAGYCGSVVFSGSPPTSTFQPPRRGMFLGTDNLSEDSYNPDQKPLLCIRLAMFADGVDDMSAAGAWAERAFSYSLSDPRLSALVRSFSWLRVAPALSKDDWRTAVEAAYILVSLRTISPTLWDDLPGAAELKRERVSSISENALKDIGIQKAIFPIAITLATLRFVRTISADVSAVVALLRGTADPTLQPINDAAELIVRVFSLNDEWDDLYKQIATYYADGKIGLGMIATLGCILRASLLQSLAFQIRFAQTIDRLFPASSLLRKHTAESFFIAYWRDKAASGDVGFRTAPMYAQRRISEISAGQPGTRLRSLLADMTFCVGLNVGAEDRQWLNGEVG